MPDARRKLFAHQRSAVRWIVECHSRGLRGCILADEMGLGKAQPLSCKILTPTGWVKMGEVKTGDRVIGRDGRPHRVTGVYPQGVKPVFDVTFSDGSKTQCCDDHLWAVNTALHNRAKATHQVKPLAEIRRRLTDGAGNRRHFIPIVCPVAFDPQPVPIDPYLMGYLLANGGLTGLGTSICCPDVETVKRLTPLLPPGAALKQVSGSTINYGISGVGGLLESLKLRFKGSPDKFVPTQYLYNSIDVRTRLLQGYLDGDGSVTASTNVVEAGSTSRQLASDIAEIIQSLGGVVRTKLRPEPWFTFKGERRTGRPFWRLTVSVPNATKPFVLSRKAGVYKGRVKYPPSRSIASVEPAGEAECQCISVDSPDSLYVTDDYIVTHNTTSALVAARCHQQYDPAVRVVVVAPKSLGLNWRKEAAAVDARIDSVHTNHAASLPDSVPGPWVLIVDEAHCFQDLGSQRTKKLLSLIEGRRGGDPARATILLTGTPVKNGRPVNLLPLLKAINHPLVAGGRSAVEAFKQRYCGPSLAPTPRGLVKTYTGASNLAELHAKTADAILRRLTKDCIDLPELTRVLRPVELTAAQEADYLANIEAMRADYEARLDRGEVMSGGEAIVTLGQLRLAGSVAKVAAAVELAEQCLEEGSQVVIFTEYLQTAATLAEHFGVEPYTGSTGVAEREAIVGRFQAGEDRVFVGIGKAGGVGLTLHAHGRCRNVILVDRPWTPGDAEQEEKRAHRIGQPNAVCSTWLQLGEADARVDAILVAKKRDSELVLSGRDGETLRFDFDPREVLRDVTKAMGWRQPASGDPSHRVANGGGGQITQPAGRNPAVADVRPVAQDESGVELVAEHDGRDAQQ